MNMSDFLTSCPEHGHVELSTEQLELVIIETADYKRFRCPIGKEIVLEKVNLYDITGMKTLGCNVIVISPPAIDTGLAAQLPVNEVDIDEFHAIIDSIDTAAQREIFNAPS